MYLDSHCHLERATYGSELGDVIARALAEGVTRLVAVGSSGVLDGAREAIALAQEFESIYAAVAIHPHEAAKSGPQDVPALAGLARQPKVVALGEIGLDYHYDFSPREVQRRLFVEQLHLAREVKLPVMLHVREAHGDTSAVLDEVGLPERGGVVHCFTGGPDEARAYLSRGLHLSIPGVITFKNAEALRAAVRAAPLDRLLIETDSPYLAPVPYRGERNEPAHLVKTAEAIAALKGLSAEDIGRITSRNASRLFDLPAESDPVVAYPIRESLYVNLTNRCTLGCTFCPKIERRDFWVRGHFLKLGHEPTAAEAVAAVQAELARRPELREVAFVGLGESTLRLDALLEVAKVVRRDHGRKLHLRVDTDGLASLVHGRDVASELAPLIDAVSVSLNAPDAATYAKLCPSRYREAAYPAVKEFIRAAKRAGLKVEATAVTVPGLDIEACRQIAEEELGVAFRARVYQEYG